MTEEQKNLVLEHQKLVYKVISDHKYFQIEEHEDAVMTGMIGLIAGVKTFDESKGFKISGYLYECIKNALRNEYTSSKRQKRRSELMDFSLDYDLSEDMTLADTIPSDINVEKEALLNIEIEKMYKAIDMLKKPYHDIVCYKYGLKGHRPHTLKETAKHFGVSSQMICVKLRKIYDGMKEEMKKNELT